ncbi:MAG: SRPBCC family protein [Gemmatimonadota bacterium]|nr:SRPBCC family protein [Gemmatimonadota bacterium]
MSAPEPQSGGPAGAGFRFNFPVKVLAAAAAMLGAALVTGLLLPGTWRAERSTLVEASPAAVFVWLEDPRRWDRWAPLGDVATTFSGPERGVGATRSWDHTEMGDGTFTLTAVVPGREVRYRVSVQEGSLVTEGALTLESEGNGTRVTWSERGDFGLNPLMGFMARGMDRLQGAQMEGALARLAELATASGG